MFADTLDGLAPTHATTVLSYRAIFENHRQKSVAVVPRFPRVLNATLCDRPSNTRHESLLRPCDSHNGIRTHPLRPGPGQTLEHNTRTTRSGRDPLRPSIGYFCRLDTSERAADFFADLQNVVKLQKPFS